MLVIYQDSVKYGIYEGVLYFPNITRLYEKRINVTLFTPVRWDINLLRLIFTKLMITK